MIERRSKKVILQYLADFPAVGLVGPRQSGKTTLAKSIAQHIKEDVLYLDLENPEHLQRLHNAQLYLEQHQEKLIILDETQRLPSLFPLLRSLIDKDRRPGQFLILGSASPSLKRQSSESLAGRIAYHELTPLTLDEIGQTRETIVTHWLRGGYPNSFLSSTDKQAFTWLNNFIQTHLERDLPTLGIRIPATTLYRFWTMLAHCSSQTWNASQLAGSLGTDSKTVRRYLDILEESFMLRQLPPFYANTKKRLIKTPKVYVRDTGILHALLKITSHDDLLAHPILGASWEGWVIEQILAIMPLSSYDISFYRTRAGAEIDLVLSKGQQVEIAIEVKHSTTPKLTKSFWNAHETLAPKQTYVVYSGQELYPLADNIWAVPATELQTIFTNSMRLR